MEYISVPVDIESDNQPRNRFKRLLTKKKNTQQTAEQIYNQLKFFAIRRNAGKGKVGRKGKKIEKLLALLESLENTPVLKTCLAQQDERGQTLLHMVADRSDAEVVKILLDYGADPLIRDQTGRIPLHLVVDLQVDGEERGCRCENCCNKDQECVKHLVEVMIGKEDNLENVDISDKNGKTPLYYTAQNMMPQCATVLLEKGANILPTKEKSSSGEKIKNIGEIIVQKIPEVMAGKLDEGVQFHPTDSSILELDFKVILQRQDMNADSNRKETDLLVLVLKAHKAGREAILTHPLIEAFLYLKWKSVSYWFWVIRILYYLLAMLYTIFIFNVYLINCPDPDIEDDDVTTEATRQMKHIIHFRGKPVGAFEDDIDEPEDDDGVCSPTTIMTVMASLMTVGVIFMICNELYEIYTEKTKYFQVGLNYAWWILIICVILTILPAFGMEQKDRTWLYPVAAFGVFYAWGMTLVQVGRIPRVGVYGEMLGKVLKDFVIFAVTYFSLFLGFALGFCVLFPQVEMFHHNSIPLALTKVLLMMIGEADYESLFQENGREDDLDYSVLAHIIYVGFIIVMTIVLMNLLLGLAVSDIQELQKTAELMKVTRQIQQIALFESLIYSKFLPVSLSAWATDYFSIVHLAETEGSKFSFSPTNPDDRQIPEELKGKFVKYLTSSPCLNIRKSKRRDRDEDDEGKTESEIEVLQRSVDNLQAQLELIMEKLEIQLPTVPEDNNNNN